MLSAAPSLTGGQEASGDANTLLFTQVLRQERLMETQHSQHVSDTSAVEADELFTSLGWSDWF